MIRAVALDDEPPALEVIKSHCAKFEKIALVGCFTNLRAMSSFLEKNEVQLLFLDIHLKGDSGLDIAYSLKNEYAIIFTTAYADHAVKGFDLDVVDYLLKPIDYQRFSDACDKFLTRHTQQSSNELILKDGSVTHKISISEIIYIESEGNYVKLFLTKKYLLIRKTLKEMLSELPAGIFVRIHKSYVINKTKITTLDSSYVHINAIKLPLGNNYKDNLKL